VAEERARREIVERLAGGINLVVVLAVREGEEFVKPCGEPGSVARHVHLASLKSR
jgi:hypothetical protein